jgi:hypothetical protein
VCGAGCGGVLEVAGRSVQRNFCILFTLRQL